MRTHLSLDNVLALCIGESRNGFTDEIKEEFGEPDRAKGPTGQCAAASMRRGLDLLLRILLLALLELERLDEALRIKMTLLGRLESMEDGLELVERSRLQRSKARSDIWSAREPLASNFPRKQV